MPQASSSSKHKQSVNKLFSALRDSTTSLEISLEDFLYLRVDIHHDDVIEVLKVFEIFLLIVEHSNHFCSFAIHRLLKYTNFREIVSDYLTI